MGVRAATHARGLTFRAYCYNAGAENQYLRRLGLFAGLAEDIEEFVASDEWVDMLKVWDSQLITGRASGLKVVAPLIGFHWEVDDAGGGESTVRYDAAATGDDAARRWLLDYNRGVVEATLAVREWMGSAVVPGVDALPLVHRRPSNRWQDGIGATRPRPQPKAVLTTRSSQRHHISHLTLP